MITNSLSKAGPFSCDGVQTSFDFEFPVLDTSHVAVYVDDSPVTTGFSVSLFATGGRVTFAAAPANGSVVAIVRDVPVTQGVDLQNNTAFLPEVIESALDRLTMICQQLKETFTRTLTLPPTSEFDQDTIYARFADLIANAETWAEQALTGAQTATGAAQRALNSAQTAQTAGTNAVSAAGSAAEAAIRAAEADENISAIAGRAELNHATLAFGEWGVDGAYIAYNEWTDAATILDADTKIAAHNDSAAAHADLRTAITAAENATTAKIATHNSSGSAHGDLRVSLAALDAKLNNTSIRAYASNRCWVSPPITPVAGTWSNVNHALNLSDDEMSRARVEVRLKCVTADGSGYSPGEYASFITYGNDTQKTCFFPVARLTAGNVAVVTGIGGINIIGKTNFKQNPVTLANWAYEFRIWY